MSDQITGSNPVWPHSGQRTGPGTDQEPERTLIPDDREAGDQGSHSRRGPATSAIPRPRPVALKTSGCRLAADTQSNETNLASLRITVPLCRIGADNACADLSRGGAQINAVQGAPRLADG
jgi:hypothetical protein